MIQPVALPPENIIDGLPKQPAREIPISHQNTLNAGNIELNLPPEISPTTLEYMTNARGEHILIIGTSNRIYYEINLSTGTTMEAEGQVEDYNPLPLPTRSDYAIGIRGFDEDRGKDPLRLEQLGGWRRVFGDRRVVIAEGYNRADSARFGNVRVIRADGTPTDLRLACGLLDISPAGDRSVVQPTCGTRQIDGLSFGPSLWNSFGPYWLNSQAVINALGVNITDATVEEVMASHLSTLIDPYLGVRTLLTPVFLGESTYDIHLLPGNMGFLMPTYSSDPWDPNRATMIANEDGTTVFAVSENGAVTATFIPTSVMQDVRSLSGGDFSSLGGGEVSVYKGVDGVIYVKSAQGGEYKKVIIDENGRTVLSEEPISAKKALSFHRLFNMTPFIVPEGVSISDTDGDEQEETRQVVSKTVYHVDLSSPWNSQLFKGRTVPGTVRQLKCFDTMCLAELANGNETQIALLGAKGEYLGTKSTLPEGSDLLAWDIGLYEELVPGSPNAFRKVYKYVIVYRDSAGNVQIEYSDIKSVFLPLITSTGRQFGQVAAGEHFARGRADYSLERLKARNLRQPQTPFNIEV